MTKKIKNNKTEVFKDEASEVSENWLKLMSNNKLYESELLCLTFIKKYKDNLGKYLRKNKEAEYYCLQALLIFFKGLQEISLFLKLTKNQNWFNNNKLVEKIWVIKCDAKERLEFVSFFVSGLVMENALKIINQFEEQFRQLFGDGLYLSPGLIIDKYICNICHQDTRACIHIAGKLYKRKICKYEPVNIQVNHVAIVKSPKDMRCRLWPWNMKKTSQEMLKMDNSLLLTNFAVNDFLQQER